MTIIVHQSNENLQRSRNHFMTMYNIIKERGIKNIEQLYVLMCELHVTICIYLKVI